MNPVGLLHTLRSLSEATFLGHSQYATVGLAVVTLIALWRVSRERHTPDEPTAEEVDEAVARLARQQASPDLPSSRIATRLLSTLRICEENGEQFSLVLGLIQREHSSDAAPEARPVFESLVRSATSGMGLLVWTGENEFALLVPHSGIETVSLCERLRIRWQTMAFGLEDGVPYLMTACFGVAQWEPPLSPAELLRRAQHALTQSNTLYPCTLETDATL